MLQNAVVDFSGLWSLLELEMSIDKRSRSDSIKLFTWCECEGTSQ